jgi:hypothetical protein
MKLAAHKSVSTSVAKAASASKPVLVPFRPAILHSEISTLDLPEIAETLKEILIPGSGG